MTARCRIIIAVLLSLLLNQAGGVVLHIQGPVNPIEQTQESLTYAHHGAPSIANEHCDPASASNLVCCCVMAVSGCGTGELTASDLTLALNHSDSWSPTHSVRLHGYLPDIEPRPPRV